MAVRPRKARLRAVITNRFVRLEAKGCAGPPRARDEPFFRPRTLPSLRACRPGTAQSAVARSPPPAPSPSRPRLRDRGRGRGPPRPARAPGHRPGPTAREAPRSAGCGAPPCPGNPSGGRRLAMHVREVSGPCRRHPDRLPRHRGPATARCGTPRLHRGARPDAGPRRRQGAGPGPRGAVRAGRPYSPMLIILSWRRPSSTRRALVAGSSSQSASRPLAGGGAGQPLRSRACHCRSRSPRTASRPSAVPM